MQIINRYKKYFILGIVILILGLFCLIYFNKKNDFIEPLNNEISLIENTTKSTTKNIQTFFVDVKGSVKKPGVYEFSENDKIIDAIEKAGGLTKNAVTTNINLSRKLKSEMVVYIFSKSELTTKKDEVILKNESTINQNEIYIPNNECQCETIEVNNCIDNSNSGNNQNSNSTTPEIGQTNTKININTATILELTKLSGIGNSKAEAIITYRNNNGLFKTIEDIKNVSGLGDAIFDKIKDNITV